jgi:hypothetical protein
MRGTLVRDNCQAKVCQKRLNLSLNDVKETGLILEKTLRGGWCVYRHHVELKVYLNVNKIILTQYGHDKF